MSTQTFNLSLPKELVKQVDEAVKQDMGSRSEYFRRLALQDLGRRRSWNGLFDHANKKGKEMGITSEQQVYDILYQDKLEQRAKREQQQNKD